MIRKATAKDIDFFYYLYMHPQANPFLLYEKMEAEEFKPVFNELMAKGVLYLFMQNDLPAGMFKLVPQQYRNSHIVYLGGLAIDPAKAGKGLGLTMMEGIKAYAKAAGFKRIELSVAAINEKAINLYLKAGFEKEGVLRNFTFLKSENSFLDEVMMAYLF
jgi:RimJ/RimL family protein N-acetyltransferase